jgi:hypothetical protein
MSIHHAMGMQSPSKTAYNQDTIKYLIEYDQRNALQTKEEKDKKKEAIEELITMNRIRNEKEYKKILERKAANAATEAATAKNSTRVARMLSTLNPFSKKSDGGYKNKKSSVSQSKEILGKQRRIYKVAGSRKEHVKYKGQLIPVSDYKKLMKPKH